MQEHPPQRQSQFDLFETDSHPIFQEKQPDNILKGLKKYWTIYFNSDAPSQFNLDLSTNKVIYLLCHALQKGYFKKLIQIQEIDKFYYQAFLDFSILFSELNQFGDDEIADVLKQIFNNFSFEAGSIIQSISLLLHYDMVQTQKKTQKKIKLSIKNFEQINIQQIKGHMVQNFVCFECVVLKVNQIKLMPTTIDFYCYDCKTCFTHFLSEGNYTIPSKCKAQVKKDCKAKNFLQKKQSIKTIFYQRIKIQQIDSEGRVPLQMVCQLRDHLVGKVITGQTIKIAGIVRTQASDEKDKKVQGLFTPYLVVNSIIQKLEGITKNYDMAIIDEMKEDSQIFYSLIKSFCPTIYGNQIVKVGILLGMVGGSSKNLANQSAFRQTSHILLLGDPGIGKSQLLKFAVDSLQHSIYVNATAVTSSGLTVTINKDNNEQSLQAGALILADNGICAIDEFDKATDTSSLLQVMEQQTISIAKAGIICQLKCRVGILASANPVYGCYNKTKSFKDNTKISNAILSRFDLIFLLLDKPDPDHDKKLSQHIMKLHNQKRKKVVIEQQRPSFFESHMYSEFLSLRQKYQKMVGKHTKKYQIAHLKQYFRYVRAEIHPTLSRQATQVIKGFFLALRQNNPSSSFQITNRQLQSLIRLSMAKARLQCRNVVTQQDAIEITQLMQQSLFDSFQEMGYNINALKQQTKKVKVFKKNGQLSLPKQKNVFIQALHQQSEERQNNIWEWGDLVKLAKQLELNIGDFYNFVQRLNQDGVLLQKANKKYQFKRTFL